MLCIHVSKLYRWYKHTLSDFSRQKAAGELHRDNLEGTADPVGVPILAPEHIGDEMAIDEKHINGEFYTVLTNKGTDKIALLAQTGRNEEIGRILRPFAGKRFAVKVLTRDLANQYDWVGSTCFPNAMQVADKFHIIRQVLDQLQAHRVSFRQQLLSQRRQAWQQHKQKKNPQPFTFIT